MRSLRRTLSVMTILLAFVVIYHLWRPFKSPTLHRKSVLSSQVKIWQTWKTSITDLDTQDRSIASSWLHINPSARQEWFTDSSLSAYIAHAPVESRFSDVVESLTDPILKMDLLRYLLMYIEGGVYADMDVEARRPIREWIPQNHEHSEMSRLVVGVERDLTSDEVQGEDVDSRFSFCQYLFLAVPGHPVLLSTAKAAIEDLTDIARRRRQPLSDLKLTRTEVLATTGPTQWTKSIFRYLSKATRTNVSQTNFTGIEVPVMISDVLILPVRAFAAGQRHSRSGEAAGDDVLAFHHFRGSWIG